MVIGILQLEIHFFNPQSLKEKRMLLKSLVSRMKNKFNISIAEIDGMDLWQKTALAIAVVGSESRRVNQLLDHVISFVHEEKDLEVTREHMEIV